MNQWRVTKYDPAFRDVDGSFTHYDWTAVSDIGKVFSGARLTWAEYERVESAYISAATAFMKEAGVLSLTVSGAERITKTPSTFGEGAILNLAEAAAVVRSMLREEMWCRLEAAGGFIHVGYDYYMYVGANHHCPTSSKLARELGLFVEPFRSPYKKM